MHASLTAFNMQILQACLVFGVSLSIALSRY